MFNFRGDLYGELIEVSFIRHIRKERKFNSTAELAEQLQQDRTMIEEQFNKDRDL
ncbi:MAG: riboflavin kinase [Segatella salivae]